ncbi:hypothetical protein PC112_g14021 [Phytophthora cactorum]|nr:hypothetical protein PC112_g14021 [Phytophthora cactorum]KAG3010386.1 hypothetical protein PC120_g15085 [Phytophthora cactorum]KAG3054894.1 hypothetical protein PC121_g16070 [Phytophthora cactorum]
MFSRSGSGAGRGEVENEPELNQDRQAGGVTQRADNGAIVVDANRQKIDLKLITIEAFDGSTRNGYLDPGACNWLELLKVQIFLAKTLTKRKWSEKVSSLLNLLAWLLSQQPN